jgi:hypothetical protein
MIEADATDKRIGHSYAGALIGQTLLDVPKSTADLANC